MTKKKDERKVEKEDSANDNSDSEAEGTEETAEEEPLLIEYFSKDDLVEKIKNLEKEQDANKNVIKDLRGWQKKYMLLQAEFENSQKRWNKNRQNLRVEYTASVLKKFLPL